MGMGSGSCGWSGARRRTSLAPCSEYNPSTQVATLYCPCNGRPVALKQGTTLTYLHHDQLGSLVSATNSSGQEVASARYWPFGSLRTLTGSLPSDRLFAGQTRDALTGTPSDAVNDRFYFFRARYLDTTIGKFHTPDSIVPDPGNPQALNRYSYVLNQLLRLTDPTGHMVSAGDEGGSTGEDTAAVLTQDFEGTAYGAAPIGTAADTTGDTSA